MRVCCCKSNISRYIEEYPTPDDFKHMEACKSCNAWLWKVPETKITQKCNLCRNELKATDEDVDSWFVPFGVCNDCLHGM